MEYQKIDSVFQRDEKGRFTETWACPEFEYLADLVWEWTEKVDGTNIRLYFPGASGLSSQDIADGEAGAPRRHHSIDFRGHEHRYVQGRTDNAQLPPKLLAACIGLLQAMPLEDVFPDVTAPVVLYGEGYGAGIQKGGMYRADPHFVLFDCRVGDWWLHRADVVDVAGKLGLDVVPHVAYWTLRETVTAMREMVAGERAMFKSGWPEARPEGIVGRPIVDLWNRKGQRIITKLKFKDFR